MTSSDGLKKPANPETLQPPQTDSPKTLEGLEALTPVQIRELRRFAVQFVYQLDITQPSYFQEGSFDIFCRQFQVPFEQQRFVRALAAGVLQSLTSIDTLITAHSRNWKISRIAKVDLAVLRVCTFELIERRGLPVEVVIADAAEIGKQYGSAGSSAFVNGVLDGIAKAIRGS